MAKIPFASDVRRFSEDLRKAGTGLLKAVDYFPQLRRPDRVFTAGMSRLVNLRLTKVGAPPGTLIPVSEGPVSPTRLSYTEFDADDLIEKDDASPAECVAAVPPKRVRWIRLVGLQETEKLRQLGEGLQVHPLVLEDILNATHRPKFEDHHSYLFFILKAFIGKEHPERPTTQISILLFRQVVVTLHEFDDGVLTGVRERLRFDKARIRGLGTDALAHAIIDSIIDRVFPAFTAFGEIAEDLELEILDNPTEGTMRRIQQMKSELLLVRRSVFPMRDMFAALERSDSDLVAEKTDIYFKDVIDHVVQAIELTDTLRDVFTVLTDLYFSSVSTRMNDVMKTLTLLATIFMPLTLLVGIYGMNFDHMPELHWKYGYLLIWIIMLGTTAIMLIFFKRKRWLE